MFRLHKLIFILGGIIISILIISSVYAENPDSDFRTLPNKAFKVGEKLNYDVKYGFVTAGLASFDVKEIKKISGREAYHIIFQVNSVPSFDWFYKVRDRYETYVDVEGIFPWRFEQHIREGNYTRDFSAFFDQRKGKAITTEGTYDIPKYTNDIVSAMYFVRTYDFSDFKPGQKLHLENFYKNKVYPLDVVYHGKEKINVTAGTFNCFIVEPLVMEGGLFKSEGSILIWLTDDELKLPVRVKTKVIIGSIDAELTGYSGLAGPLTSKVK